MKKTTTSTLEDDLHLHAYLSILFRYWPVLLIFVLAAGIPAAVISATGRPVYEATAVVALPGYCTGDAYSKHFLLFDGIRDAVELNPDIPPGVDKRITVTTIERDRYLYRITGSAPSAEQAALEANTWADETIKWYRQKLLSSSRAWLNKVQADLIAEDQKLLDFLQTHGLDGYSLVDLRMYEGLTGPSDFDYPSSGEPLQLSPTLRQELRALLRSQSFAAGKYSDAVQTYTQLQLQLQTDSPAVLNLAQPPNHPLESPVAQTAKNAALAAALGLIVGILAVLFREWWTHTEPPADPKH